MRPEFFRYARTQLRGWIFIVTVTLLGTAMTVLQPWPMKILVDNVLTRRPLRGFAPQTLLIFVVISFVAIFAVNSLSDVLLTRAWARRGGKLVWTVAADMFAQLQRRSIAFHARHPIGDSLSRITGDSWSFYTIVDAVLIAPANAIITITVISIIMARLDARLMLLSIAIAPLMAVAAIVFGKRSRAVAKRTREIDSQLQSHVHQTLSGVPVVQAFAQEDRQRERFSGFTDDALAAKRRSALVVGFSDLASGTITTLGAAVVLFFGARRVIAGELTVGGLLVFLGYLQTLQTQMKVLTNTYTTLQTASAGVDRVLEILNNPPEVRERADARAITRARGEVRIENVTFGYEPQRAILQHVSLHANPGETIAIVGPTGVGKSTLVSLIPRFFDPWQGRVTLDGQDVKDLKLADLRRQIAVVLQESFLFPLSIAENIAYGRPEASRDEIIAAATAANIHEFIGSLEKGYDTIIGERGATLSGGERQRLSIARALLKDAPILILDEPTASVDAQTESSIVEALQRLMRGRTTFIIAHRLSTIRHADRVIELREGRIVPAPELASTA